MNYLLFIEILVRQFTKKETWLHSLICFGNSDFRGNQVKTQCEDRVFTNYQLCISLHKGILKRLL